MFDLKHPKQLNQSWTRFSEILILLVFEGWTVWGGGGVWAAASVCLMVSKVKVTNGMQVA